LLAAFDSGFKSPDWQVPDSIEKVEVDSVSGYPAHDDFPKTQEVVVRGTLPSLPDLVHTKLKLCKGENKLATDAKIASADYDEREFITLRESDPVSQDGRNRWQEGIDGWINGQEDGRYKVPTEYCGEQSDVSARLIRPENEKTFAEEEIEIEVQADSGDGVERIDIFVNGEIRETVNDRQYKGKLRLSSGRYEIYAKAYSRKGRDATSNKSRIGTGGQDWREPQPSPTPSPSPDPTPTLPPASPSPTPSGSGTGGPGNGNGNNDN
jgi:hypothetical protein